MFWNCGDQKTMFSNETELFVWKIPLHLPKLYESSNRFITDFLGGSTRILSFWDCINYFPMPHGQDRPVLAQRYMKNHGSSIWVLRWKGSKTDRNTCYLLWILLSQSVTRRYLTTVNSQSLPSSVKNSTDGCAETGHAYGRESSLSL